MVFRDCNSNIFDDFIRFFELRTGTVFCMVSFVKKICVQGPYSLRKLKICLTFESSKLEEIFKEFK